MIAGESTSGSRGGCEYGLMPECLLRDNDSDTELALRLPLRRSPTIGSNVVLQTSLLESLSLSGKIKDKGKIFNTSEYMPQFVLFQLPLYAQIKESPRIKQELERLEQFEKLRKQVQEGVVTHGNYAQRSYHEVSQSYHAIPSEAQDRAMFLELARQSAMTRVKKGTFVKTIDGKWIWLDFARLEQSSKSRQLPDQAGLAS